MKVYKLVRFYEPSSRGQYETTRATLTVFSAFMSSDLTADYLEKPVAIVAFILLFGTFAVGLRCFADFDRGLQSSKVDCKALVFFRHAIQISFLSAVPSRPKLASEKASSNQASPSGAPLGPRISIE
jgi:hypothetical protein